MATQGFLQMSASSDVPVIFDETEFQKKRLLRDERREDYRVPLKLKVAVVYHQHQDASTRPTYHGVTNDISLSGLSVVVDYNIFNEGEVTVLLAIPPEHHGGAQKIVEATAKMAYTVHSSDHGAFRIGMSFKVFKRNGMEHLKAALARRSFKQGNQHG
jgi:c-di-GMP-binding flagellar brake protein YcgR